MGVAPGAYSITCADCGQMVEGLDKRARRCRPCALVAMKGEPLVMKRVGLEEALFTNGWFVCAATGTSADYKVGEVVVDPLDRRWRLQFVITRQGDMPPHPTRNALLIGAAA